MNRTTFFAYARRAPFGGRLTQSQIDGMNAILDEWDRRGLLDKRWLAYMLATSLHETGSRMQPIKELGGDKYLSKYDTGKLAKALGNTPQADGDGQKFAGRGLVQITGRSNYRKFGIEARPDEALKMPTAVSILFDGMLEGKFTGRRLYDFFNQKADDPENARRIVNGTDKSKLIAGYYKNFLDAIEAATEAVPVPDAKPEDAQPDDVPPAQSKSLWTILVTLFPGLSGLAFLQNIDNVFALGAFGLVLLAVAVGAWLVFTGRITINRGKAAT